MGRDITQCHPRLQAAAAELVNICNSRGLKIKIGECFRSKAEQDELYAQGRTKPGNIVTNAPGSSYSSMHQWGVAFDFFKNIKGHEYDDTSFFREVGAIGKSLGLEWGGDWTSPVDMPHLQLDLEMILERTETAAITAIKLSTEAKTVKESLSFLETASTALNLELSGKKKLSTIENALSKEKLRQLSLLSNDDAAKLRDNRRFLKVDDYHD